MSGLKLHPRERPVQEAEIELATAYLAIVQKFELTTAEELRLCADFMSRQVGGIAKYAIREERHGNTEKPGGVE